jgi:hypothetical protein
MVEEIELGAELEVLQVIGRKVLSRRARRQNAAGVEPSFTITF